MTAFDVFLSHNSKDKLTVRRLGKALKKRGLSVWLDEWELQPGLTWMDALEEIIASCRSAIVCVGENGVGPWEVPEMQALLRRFVDEKKTGDPAPVIPVLLPGAPAEVKPPVFLGAYIWVDLRDGLKKQGLDRLEWGITGCKPEKRPTNELASPPDRQQDQSHRFAELTTCACQQIATSAGQWLAEECDPFVMPALSRRVNHLETTTSRQQADPWETLGEEETRGLVLGQLSQERNRVRIFSQSGTGKTTLLHCCEQQIAATGDGRVPVRVTALSNYDWKGDVPEILVNRVLHKFLPADSTAAERIEWLRELIRDHRVVFLLDAIDQTDDQLAGLSQFLQSADVCRCPVILTGRPEVEQTRASVFHDGNWETYRVEPFDEQRIREYLGDLSDELLPVEDEEWKDRPSYERKQQWSDLLKVPLLLNLIRRLATADKKQLTHTTLSGLHNRHAIYREAVRHMVQHGWSSLAQTDHR